MKASTPCPIIAMNRGTFKSVCGGNKERYRWNTAYCILNKNDCDTDLSTFAMFNKLDRTCGGVGTSGACCGCLDFAFTGPPLDRRAVHTITNRSFPAPGARAALFTFCSRVFILRGMGSSFSSSFGRAWGIRKKSSKSL